MTLKKAAFLDRDGVINIDHAYVHTPEEFTFIDGVFEACRKLQSAGYLLIIATNQSGIGRGYYSEEDFSHLCGWMKEQFKQQGVCIDDIFFCPHQAGDMQAAQAAGVATRILVGKDGLVRPQPIEESTHTAQNLLEAVNLIITEPSL